MPFRDASPSVLATVDGKYAGIWEVDVGAGGCDFSYPYAKANGILEREGIYKMGIGAGGPSLDRTVQFDSFELAGFIVEKPLIGFPAKEVPGVFGGDEIVGNLGNSVLRHFTVYFDYKNQKMIIEKGDDFNKEFPTSKSGLQIFYNDDNQMEVFYVSEKTPAAKAGFEVGDVVLTINGIKTEYINGLEAVRELMQAEAGTKYSFMVVRGKEQKKLELTLKDLYY
jgi:membrane-associated protease RseP (regulator of RpoE activity)